MICPLSQGLVAYAGDDSDEDEDDYDDEDETEDSDAAAVNNIASPQSADSPNKNSGSETAQAVETTPPTAVASKRKVSNIQNSSSKQIFDSWLRVRSSIYFQRLIKTT